MKRRAFFVTPLAAVIPGRAAAATRKEDIADRFYCEYFRPALSALLDRYYALKGIDALNASERYHHEICTLVRYYRNALSPRVRDSFDRVCEIRITMETNGMYMHAKQQYELHEAAMGASPAA